MCISIRIIASRRLHSQSWLQILCVYILKPSRAYLYYYTGVSELILFGTHNICFGLVFNHTLLFEHVHLNLDSHFLWWVGGGAKIRYMLL